MTSAFDISLILLTYKGKMLLMLRDNNLTQVDKSEWRFIGGIKDAHKTFKETILRTVEKETGLMLESVELLSSWIFKNRRKYFYHAQLTDSDVNNIKRVDGHALEFFSLRELEKLPLTFSTKLFVSKHRDLLEKSAN